jgi:hypothetical protein
MKTIKFAMVIAALLVMSCTGNNPERKATTVPIDSVNLNGDAPVDYGPRDPANPKPAIDPDSRDTGMKANTMNHEDSVREGLKLK